MSNSKINNRHELYEAVGPVLEYLEMYPEETPDTELFVAVDIWRYSERLRLDDLGGPVKALCASVDESGAIQ